MHLLLYMCNINKIIKTNFYIPFRMNNMLLAVVVAMATIQGIVSQQQGVDYWDGQPPTSWHRSTYPNPMIDTTKCGRYSKESHICDPNHIITIEDGRLIKFY